MELLFSEDTVYCSDGREISGVADFSKMGKLPMLRTQQLFLGTSSVIKFLGVALVTMFPRPHFLMWGFLKQRVYSNNPRSLEDPKHDNKQAVDGTDNTLFENLQETVWKG